MKNENVHQIQRWNLKILFTTFETEKKYEIWIFYEINEFRQLTLFFFYETKNIFINIFSKGLFNNCVTLKWPFFDPPTPHHQASSQMITRPPLHYVTPDTDTPPFIIYFSFWKLKKNETKKTNKDTHPPMTHPAMFLSN